MQPDHALPHEIEPAFDLLFRHLERREREYRVGRAAELIRRGEMDARGLFVLRRRGAVAGVVACEPVPGAGGILWPAVSRDNRAEEEDHLVRRACSWLRERGARLAQCLLEPEDDRFAAGLLRNGFSRVTTLSYLCNERFGREQIHPPGRLAFSPSDQANPGAFHDALLRTYEATLDCPEVNGVRTVEEVIQGHRAQGRFDPSLWWLVREQGKTVGVMILVPNESGEEWEVGYMGVVPEARRRGIGDEMLRKALLEARKAGVRRVTLSVDDRNVPAWRLYRGMGFELIDKRIVFLTVWTPAL
jgi:ribosomal protein S18 acetylase RimI-like enzyme